MAQESGVRKRRVHGGARDPSETQNFLDGVERYKGGCTMEVPPYASD